MVSPLPKLLMGVTLHHLYFRGTVHNMPIICNQESFYWLRTISKNYFSPFSARFFWLAMDTCGKRHNDRWSSQRCLFVFHRGSTNLDGFAAEPHLSSHTAKCVLLLCLASKPRTKFLSQKFSSPNLKSFYLQISKVESVEGNSFVTWQTHSLCWIQTHPKQPEKDIMEIQ